MEEENKQRGEVPLIPVKLARTFFKAGTLCKVVIFSEDGMVGIRIHANGSVYEIGTQDFTKARRWITRDKAISYICRYLGLPDTICIELKKNEEECA